MKRMKSGLVRLMPEAATDWYRRKRYGKSWLDPKDGSVSTIFSQIYERGLWGKSDSSQPFNSGPGSDPDVAAPYIDAIHALIDEYDAESVIDLGCGDFRVGAKLLRSDFLYCGVDVVKPLIEYNNEHYGSRLVRFREANLITDELPPGKLCLLRQVLQHLSNEQVGTILTKCKQYPLVVVTEHLPDPSTSFVPNADIEHGNETRVDVGSGLVLDAPPFNLKVERHLCDVVLADKTILRTVLLTNEEASLGQRVA